MRFERLTDAQVADMIDTALLHCNDTKDALSVRAYIVEHYAPWHYDERLNYGNIAQYIEQEASKA